MLRETIDSDNFDGLINDDKKLAGVELVSICENYKSLTNTNPIVGFETNVGL